MASTDSVKSSSSVSTWQINSLILSVLASVFMHPFVAFGYHAPEMGFLAWFHLVPLLLVTHSLPFWQKFLFAFATSFLSHFGVFFWLMTAMQVFGGLSFFEAVLAMSLLFLILASLFALFFSLASWIHHFVKLPLVLLLPLFLTTKDFLLHYIPFNGFPWGIPPYSQGTWIEYFQWVDVTGVLGISILIYAVNALFAEGVRLFIVQKRFDRLISRLAIVFGLGLLSLYLSFLSRQSFEAHKLSLESLNLALIQGNIPQDQKWDRFKAQDNLNTYLKRTNQAIRDGAQLVIWPETALPYGLAKERVIGQKFLGMDRLKTPLIFGAIVSDRRGPSEVYRYNSVVLAEQDGKQSAVYHKTHLVPFGEYLPLKSLLGFLGKLTSGVGEMSPGPGPEVFEALGYRVGNLICFEDIFPRYARLNALLDTDFLVNYTNDAWYGDSSAQHQHLVFSQFRALENRRFLVRSTNTGVTALIDPGGEVLRTLPPFRELSLIENVKLEKAQSFYTRHGDTWALMAGVVCFVLFLYSGLKVILGPVNMKY